MINKHVNFRFEATSIILILDPKIETMAPTKVATKCPNQIVDESFLHTYNDIHPKGLKTNADNEIRIPRSPTNEAMGESFKPNEEVPRSGDISTSSSPAQAQISLGIQC